MDYRLRIRGIVGASVDALVQKAVKKKINFLISHHGFGFPIRILKKIKLCNNDLAFIPPYQNRK